MRPFHREDFTSPRTGQKQRSDDIGNVFVGKFGQSFNEAGQLVA